MYLCTKVIYKCVHTPLSHTYISLFQKHRWIIKGGFGSGGTLPLARSNPGLLSLSQMRQASAWWAGSRLLMRFSVLCAAGFPWNFPNRQDFKLKKARKEAQEARKARAKMSWKAGWCWKPMSFSVLLTLAFVDGGAFAQKQRKKKQGELRIGETAHRFELCPCC